MYLTSDMMAAIKRRGNIPTSQQMLQPADFYALIDEELRSKLLPLILKDLEEYYVRNLDYAITSGQNAYMIPTRAIAGKLRDVQIINPAQPDSPCPIERLDPSDLFAAASGNSRFNIQKSGFYLQGNNVILYPGPTATQNTLRLLYYTRPGASVDPSACGLVTAIDTVANQLTISVLPSTMSAGVLVDFVKASPGFDCTAIDQPIATALNNVLTFSTLPTSLAVGDYVCLSGQSCVVQVPVELQPLLIQYALVRVLEALGDTQILQPAMTELGKLEENAQLLISPRVSGKPKRVVNTRGISRWV